MKKTIRSDEVQTQLNLKLIERLSSSERRYRKLVTHLKQIIFQLDNEGRLSFLNPAWENITKIDIQQALKEPLYTFLPDLNQEDFEALIQQCLNGDREEVFLESQLCTNDHSLIPVEISLSAQSEINEVSGFVGTIIDISSHKELLNELNKQRQRLVNALKGANDGYWDWNLETNEVYYSPRWKGMLGYRPDELTDNNLGVWEGLVHPEDKDKTLQQVQRYLAGDIDKFEAEFRMRHKSGHWVNILSRASIAEDEHGHQLQPHSLVGTHIDDTERKQTELKLIKQNIALESAANAIFMTDADGKIEWTNKAFLEISGYDMEDIIGNHPRDLIHTGQQGKELFDGLVETVYSGKVWQGDVVNHRKDGSLYDAHLTITPVLDEQQQVTNFIAVQYDITRRKQIEKEVKQLAFFDPLTRLPNRRTFMDKLEYAVTDSRRSETYSALLFIDLDNFKTINDSFGHDVGDLLLINAAERIASCVRENDLVARLGGDEFVVILQGMSSDADQARKQAAGISRKILHRMSIENRHKTVNFTSTCSIGVCLFKHEYASAEDILKRADTAMYEAKKRSRNDVYFYHPNMQQDLENKIKLEQELSHAISGEQLRLFYQLIIDPHRKVVGAEALLRWQHPQQGIIGPDKLFPLIEENGMIIPIGEWVISEGLRQLKHWQQDSSTAALTLSINISAVQFRRSDFVSKLIEAIEAQAIDSRRLYLELTESTLISSFSLTHKKINELNEFGIRTSLDDFGTGYSSLSYLKRFNVSQLKIDRSFVQDILSNESDYTLVRTIVQMGKNLDLQVVAEGVANEQQFELLKSCGCDRFQGFWINQPAPAEQLQALVEYRQAATELHLVALPTPTVQSD